MAIIPRNTINGHFEIDFAGHVQTEEALKKNFIALDKLLGVKPIAADVGKAVVVVDNGDGTYGYGIEP